MSYRWGFDLNMAAVRLMRREAGHWREIAAEKIEGADIEDRLMAMVDRIDPGEPVDLFLPRDQILYTDVAVSSETAAPGEIEAAMDGRTPYSVDELEIDWEITGDGTARVAAIALETLDEAAAFAEARGLKVRGYSAFAEPDEFPRMPDFGGTPGFPEEEEIAEEEDEGDEAPPVTFASARPALRSAVSSPAAHAHVPVVASADEGPVVRVDDPTPVMQVRSRTLPPLDPGQPLRRTPATPRIRTDIAAATVSGQAASLSPMARPSVRVMRPAGSAQRTLLIFLAAALLTVAIAWVVWSILPMAPGRTEISPPAETGLSEVPPDADTTATTDPAPVPEETAEAVPELPQPEAVTPSVALGPVPAPETAPEVPLEFPDTVSLMETPYLAVPDASAAIPVAPIALERRPEKLAGIGALAPEPGPDPSEDVAETTDAIYFASIEPRDLAFDAIALPSVTGLSADGAPRVGTAPAPFAQDAALADGTEAGQTAEPPADVAMLETPEAELPAPLAEPASNAEDGGLAAPEAAPEVAALPETDAAPLEETGEAEATSAMPVPTPLASSLPDRAPRARPKGFVAEIERSQFGGRTREELARMKPPARPQSAQSVAVAAREPAPASELAVESSAPPKGRPDDFDGIVAAAIASVEASRAAAAVVNYDSPDTSAAVEAALSEDAEPEVRPQDSPRLAIPSSASVARQATLEDAIRLNQINLIGVYGVPSDRRALIRLPSGRYLKVKVGDRVDGGTVASISDTALVYRKGTRSVSLTMPEG